jgi:sensor histidine kinase YesM
MRSIYNLINYLLKIILARLTRNILFWGIFVGNLFSNGTFESLRNNESIFFINVGVTLILFASFQYINSLWLLPAYLKNGRHKIYFIGIVVTIIVYGCLFAVYNYFFDKYVHETSFTSFTFIALGSQNLYQDIQNGLVSFFEVSVLAMVPLCFFGFLFSLGWFMNDYFLQQKRLEKALAEKVESEIALIKHQLSPHFLFNTLNNLYSLSLKKSDELPDLLIQLSNILRYMIDDSKQHSISFEKEKETMLAYIDIEKLRLNNSNQLKFKISSDKPTSLPPLLWLPVLENVFKHADFFDLNENTIVFEFMIFNNRLKIYSNNKYKEKHVVKNIKENSGGFGLNSLKKRLDNLYPENYLYKVEKANGIFTIEIVINLV